MLDLTRRLQLDKTRRQIFLGFIFAMLLVLTLTVGFSYKLLSKIQNENAEKYIDEFALQVSGRLSAIFNEIDTLTLQLSVDERVQELLSNELDGYNTNFDERAAMRQVLLNTSAYSNAFDEIELYSVKHAIWPIVDKSIKSRIGNENIREADQNRGGLVWIGRDLDKSNSILAIRKIPVEKRRYETGGYLVVRIKPSIIEFIHDNLEDYKGSVIFLVDSEGNDVLTGKKLGKSPNGANSSYITVKQKVEGTKWKLVIFFPKKEITKGISVLKKILIGASILGVSLFAVLSYFLSSLITSPIKMLTKVMKKSKEGNILKNQQHYFNREINDLNIVYNQMVEKINYLIETIYEKEILKSRSEISALHSQINPHFLFNTLDSLYWSLIRKSEDELATFVVKLADLFRYTIQSNGNNGLVSILDEIEQINRYVDIMKTRWRERLSFTMEVDSEVLMNQIPKLTIQPIIENAITHGIEAKGEGGTVKLTIKVIDEVITIKVSDNGVGIEAATVKEIQRCLSEGVSLGTISKGTGIGLFTIDRLTQMYFGKEFGLEINSIVNKGTVVILRLPVRS
jgi:two-component system, sensor histidine kinase YesM